MRTLNNGTLNNVCLQVSERLRDLQANLNIVQSPKRRAQGGGQAESERGRGRILLCKATDQQAAAAYRGQLRHGETGKVLSIRAARRLHARLDSHRPLELGRIRHHLAAWRARAITAAFGPVGLGARHGGGLHVQQF